MSGARRAATRLTGDVQTFIRLSPFLSLLPPTMLSQRRPRPNASSSAPRATMSSPSNSLVLVLVALLLPMVAEARRSSQALELETNADYFWAGFKVLAATSPILLIVGMLMCLREDDEAEAAKTNSKVRSCKT